MTFEEALNLKYGQSLIHYKFKNADKSPVRCKVNGKVKQWKTRPGEFLVPVKRGLYQFFYLDQGNASEWSVA